jgi:hypothetical protein
MHSIHRGDHLNHLILPGKQSEFQNSHQLTRADRTSFMKLVNYSTIPSPAEVCSYGTNGDAVLITPEDIYIEHNMKYVVSTHCTSDKL